MLSGNVFNLKKLIQTPPVIALAVGILLIPFSVDVESLGSGRSALWHLY